MRFAADFVQEGYHNRSIVEQAHDDLGKQQVEPFGNKKAPHHFGVGRESKQPASSVEHSGFQVKTPAPSYTSVEPPRKVTFAYANKRERALTNLLPLALLPLNMCHIGAVRRRQIDPHPVLHQLCPR